VVTDLLYLKEQEVPVEVLEEVHEEVLEEILVEVLEEVLAEVLENFLVEDLEDLEDLEVLVEETLVVVDLQSSQEEVHLR